MRDKGEEGRGGERREERRGEERKGERGKHCSKLVFCLIQSRC
jgi:hypothetical protein